MASTVSVRGTVKARVTSVREKFGAYGSYRGVTAEVVGELPEGFEGVGRVWFREPSAARLGEGQIIEVTARLESTGAPMGRQKGLMGFLSRPRVSVEGYECPHPALEKLGTGYSCSLCGQAFTAEVTC